MAFFGRDFQIGVGSEPSSLRQQIFAIDTLSEIINIIISHPAFSEVFLPAVDDGDNPQYFSSGLKRR